MPVPAGACDTLPHSCACTWAKSAWDRRRPTACPTSLPVYFRNRCRLGLLAVVVGGDGFGRDGVCAVVVGDGSVGDPRNRTPPTAACTLGRQTPSAADRRLRRRRNRRLPPGCPVRRAVCPRNLLEADNSHRRLRKRTRPTAVCNRWRETKVPPVAATRRCNDSAWARLEELPRPGAVSFCAVLRVAVGGSCGLTAESLRLNNFSAPIWIRRDRAVKIRK